MEFYEESIEKQKKLERFNLIVYTFYAINLSLRAISKSWEVWISLFLVSITVFAWVLYIKQYKSYAVRSLVMSLVVAITMLICGLHTPDFRSFLTTFYVLSLIIALYGTAEYIFISIFIIIILFVNYGARLGEQLLDATAFRSIIIQSVNVIMVQVMLWVLNRSRIKSMQNTMNTIDALKIAERSKDDFLANISHEIRTPLNTIVGMSEMILPEENLETIHEQVYSIQMAGRNLMSTVNDILDFSELQTGEVTLEEENYDIIATVNDITNMAVALRGEKAIELIVDCDADLPAVLYGDEKKIRRVVMNLVNNAIKFTKDGCVSISVKSRKESYGINLIISIKDTGIGMNTEDMGKLFSGFGQLDTRRNRQNGGVGLGLAISKILVEKMGGTILVNSELGKGSTMKVVIPQKVVEDKPAVAVDKLEETNVLIYINMEVIGIREIRDAYMETMGNMLLTLQLPNHVCRSLSELKRRLQREHFSHIIITDDEYLEDVDYFKEVSSKMRVILLLDRINDKLVADENVCRVYKPFFVKSIVAAINGQGTTKNGALSGNKRQFVAPSAKILVVDDNRMNIRLIEHLMVKYKISVVYALSGAEALEKIDSMDYDFVFMDHMMPEMDGVETFHRIRDKQGKYYQNVPIIALTANAVAGSREMFIKEGFDDFVEKPIEISVLERILKRYIPENKLVYEEKTEEMPVVNGKEKEDKNVVPKEKTDMPYSREEEHEKSNEMAVEETPEQKGMAQILELDTSAGTMYCGGEEGFRMILLEFCESAMENQRLLEQLFEEEDWKNYVIKVHALKSSMKTVGAMDVSNAALELELAGKEGNIDMIREKHGPLMEMHLALFQRLIQYPILREGLTPEVITGIEQGGKQEEIEPPCENLTEIGRDAFGSLLNKFEMAAYNLDGDIMKEIAEQLEYCQYEGTSLTKEIGKVRKKIEQEDYFSAFELLDTLYQQSR